MSRGELDGCEDKAEAAVTRGCLREIERSTEAERSVEADADADLGLGRISHVGSCDRIDDVLEYAICLGATSDGHHRISCRAVNKSSEDFGLMTF